MYVYQLLDYLINFLARSNCPANANHSDKIRDLSEFAYISSSFTVSITVARRSENSDLH